MHTPKPPPAPHRMPPDRRMVKGVFARAVGSFVPKLAGKAFEKYGFHTAEIMTAWPRVVGADIASYTAPERIKWPRGYAVAEDGAGATEGATLVLRVEPARALDIEYRSAEIVDRINRYFGYRAIASVRLVQVPLAHKIQEPQSFTPPPLATGGPAVITAPIPPEADGDLKLALEALWTSVAARNPRR